MRKIDLIIDALESYFCLDDSTQFTMDKAYAALAAARELKALKPVAFVDDGLLEWGDDYSSRWGRKNDGVKLYALDEVTK